MARDIRNKVAVITGGAEGIGYEIAVHFLKNGVDRVIILDFNESLGKVTVENLTKVYGEKIDFMKCDVTKDLDAVSSAILKKYKTVDILVNNAGIVNEFDIKKTMAVNSIAVIEWSFKFIEHMRIDKGGKGGTILNMASIYGFRNDPFLPIYKASKHAVMGFTKTIGHEHRFKKTGVRVVAICPGYTESKLTKGFDVPEEEDKKDFAAFLRTPEALWQKADAVGKAAVEIFNVADSGTAWIIEGGKPIENFEENIGIKEIE